MFLKHNAGKCILIIEFMRLFSIILFYMYYIKFVKKLFIIVQKDTRKKEYFK